MRYAAIRSFDVTNGEGNGVSLFVQGCPFHCRGCFNSETWDFNGGNEWTPEIEEKFMNYISRSYIKRVSFLGGSPLCEENIEDVYKIIKRVSEEYPDKKIWVYTGRRFEELENHPIMKYIDILIDGRFEYDKKDFNLLFRGSKNQRVIDVQKTLEGNNGIVLYF